MNIHQLINLKLAELPIAMQQEVLDFTNFLLERCESHQMGSSMQETTVVKTEVAKSIGKMAPTFLPPSALEEANVPSVYQGPPISLEAMQVAIEEETAHHV
jgi:hypothetical protein